MKFLATISLLLHTGPVLMQADQLQGKRLERASSFLASYISFFLTCVTVTAFWEGAEITGPILLYHDEITVDTGPSYAIGQFNRSGALVCQSTGRNRVAWRDAEGVFFQDVNIYGLTSTTNYQMIRNPSADLPSLARLTRANANVIPTASSQNGLWLCRVHSIPAEGEEGLQRVLSNFRFAGLYRRAHGKCNQIAI